MSMPRRNTPRVQVNNLSYTFPDYSTGVRNISLDLPPRSRTLLIGANGAGKTTLLRLLAGKRLAPSNTINICGVDPFKETAEGVTYLGLEWVLNPIVRNDIGVVELLRSVGGDAYPERRDELVAMLDIDINWRMHAVSDGERRRVQLAMGLLRPWTVLFLDEITVDLDVLSRAEFLGWLKRETQTRECTIVYATHILDNLAGWPTHLVHMHLGAVKEWDEADEMLQSLDGTVGSTGNSRLGELVLGWLKADLEARGPRSQANLGSEGKTYGFGGIKIGGYGDESKQKEN
ncbi:ABC transporter ATP-binding protein [Tolypocladium capitatum]|uniref:ABC transporter ATP-binding protein n=1 Tax=Tolypocladium capitatum TaxID=45235 RepID=A0A2K3QCF0_9HYPO|nr:ABC transporter ATP-binding protein [Tolypocladium capitatum]